MRPTSSKYWCEHRDLSRDDTVAYCCFSVFGFFLVGKHLWKSVNHPRVSWGYFQYSWDDHYQVPLSTCNSPRYTALGLQSEPAWSNGSVTTGTGHRRLGGGSSGNGSTATHDPPPCEDNDTAYQIAEDKPNTSCDEDASHACQIDLGILLCPKTCGYCAPFEYESLQRLATGICFFFFFIFLFLFFIDCNMVGSLSLVNL